MQRSISITTISLGMFARKSSTGFRHKLGSYLYQSGLAKRAIDTLAGFGFTPTYKYVNKAVNRMVERSEVCSSCRFMLAVVLNAISLGSPSWQSVSNSLSLMITSIFRTP
jgi:hypothetical protein